MATLTRFNPVWVGSTLNSAEPLFRGSAIPVAAQPNLDDPWLYETASQTYAAGDLVQIDSSGTVAIATVASNLLTGSIAGIAQSAAIGGSTRNQAFIRVIRPDDLYLMHVFHTTAASAITALTGAGSMLRAYGIRQDTVTGNGTLLWGVDLVNAVEGANNRAAYVRIVGFPLKSPIGEKMTLDSNNSPIGGDVYATVLVQFLPISIFNTFGTYQRNLQLA